jgi:hypothetical protein
MINDDYGDDHGDNHDDDVCLDELQPKNYKLFSIQTSQYGIGAMITIKNKGPEIIRKQGRTMFK